jgi:uncharacterized protein YigE (DUF2233 family)
MRHRSLCLDYIGKHLVLIIALLLAACGDAEPTAQPPPPTRPIPTLFPTNAVVPLASQPVEEQSPNIGWLAGGDGIEMRRLRATEEVAKAAIPLVVVRLDPARVQLRVAYSPDRPRALRSWFDEARPLVAINGGFFTEDYRSAALVIGDGQVSGASYTGFGGMLAVAPDGGISLRALSDQPYDPAEPLAQAMQSFPMLVFPGGTPAEIQDDGKRARRTAVALDRAGRLLLIVSPTGDFTLRGFADWLSHSDLDIDRALNFDGGSSTGLFLRSGDLSEQIDSFGPLPLVLLVEQK